MAFNNKSKLSIGIRKSSEHSNQSVLSFDLLATGFSDIAHFVNTYIIINGNAATEIKSTLTSDIIEQL